MIEEEEWPKCQMPDCGDEVDPRRWALGYRTCINCGSPIKKFTVASPYNKGGLQLISSEDLEFIGRK